VDPKNINALFVLLNLSILLQKNQAYLQIEIKHCPEEYALKIKEMDNYLGYLAWAEIYLATKKTEKFGRNVLRELVKEYPSQPEGYLRMWSIKFEDDFMLEISEKMFIMGTEVTTFEAK
jgi:hypothetical protein